MVFVANIRFFFRCKGERRKKAGEGKGKEEILSIAHMRRRTLLTLGEEEFFEGGEGIDIPRFRTILIGPADRRILLITNSFSFFCLAGPILQPAKHPEKLTFVFLLKNAESVRGCAFCRILRAIFYFRGWEMWRKIRFIPELHSVLFLLIKIPVQFGDEPKKMLTLSLIMTFLVKKF